MRQEGGAGVRTCIPQLCRNCRKITRFLYEICRLIEREDIVRHFENVQRAIPSGKKSQHAEKSRFTDVFSDIIFFAPYK